MKNKKWNELTVAVKEELLKGARVIDGITGISLDGDGECIIDFENGLSVAGTVVDGEIVIAEDDVIYDPAE